MLHARIVSAPPATGKGRPKAALPVLRRALVGLAEDGHLAALGTRVDLEGGVVRDAREQLADAELDVDLRRTGRQR